MAVQVIPKQDVVKVDITLQTLFEKQRNFGLPIFITAENTPDIDQGERVRSYATIADVAEDWNSTDEVFLMAQTAFSQAPQPGEILIGVRFTSNQPALLKCAPLKSGVDVDTFKAVTDGAFKITVDGILKDIVTINFSTVTTLDDVATAITGAMAGGATCTYDATTNRFVFTSALAGDLSSVSYLEAGSSGTDISGDGFLNGLSGSSARTVDGLTVGTVVDEVTNILDVNNEAYFLAFTKELRDTTDLQDVAEYVEALPNGHQLFITSNDAGVLDSSVFTDIASVLQGLSLNRTWVHYSGYAEDYPEVSALARAATVNWDGADTALTLKFKQLPGITPENGSGIGVPAFRTAQLNIVKSKSANAYSTMGSINMIVSEAVMASGRYQDEVHFADWLADAIETRVFNILQAATTKVPYTEPGLDRLQIGMENALNQAIRNGGIAPAVGASGQYVPAFSISRIPVRDIAPSVRAEREYPGFQFLALLSGAIHAVKPIQGTLTIILP